MSVYSEARTSFIPFKLLKRDLFKGDYTQSDPYYVRSQSLANWNRFFCGNNNQLSELDIVHIYSDWTLCSDCTMYIVFGKFYSNRIGFLDLYFLCTKILRTISWKGKTCWFGLKRFRPHLDNDTIMVHLTGGFCITIDVRDLQ